MPFFIAFTLCACFISCEEEEVNISGGDYALITQVVSADFTTYTSYGQAIDLSTAADSSFDNSNAEEMDAQYNFVPFVYNGSIYCNKYTISTMEKWDVDENGAFSMTADMDFTDIGYQCNLCFYSDEVAFTGGNNSFEIAIFNPTTMKRTGFIDLSAYSKLDSVSGFPEESSTIGLQAISEMIVRDNYLYAAVYYCISGVGDWTPALNGCYMFVIDLDEVDPDSEDNSDAVVKEIYDSRGSATGAWGAGLGSSYMILDENNDIYVLCHNMWGYYETVTGLPACVLRIKDGETEFDDSYYFNLEEASAGGYNPVVGIEYAGDGLFFGPVQDPSAIDADNAWSYYVDPIYQWYQFDLYDQSAELVNETYTKGAEACKTYFEDGYAYLPFATSDVYFIMKTNVETLETEKYFSTDGDPVIFKIN